jgi:hypothetical protein
MMEKSAIFGAGCTGHMKNDLSVYLRGLGIAKILKKRHLDPCQGCHRLCHITE